MFKRPRGSKDREAMASITNKRLKEDSFASPRHEGCGDDYANLTYSPKQNGCSNAINPVYQAAVLPRSAESGSPEEQAELVRYNRLKLQHRGGRRHEAGSQCDSDNSSISSEMSEVHSELSSREREHYNKLKVDINKIQTNKKLLKGVKILAQSSTEPLHCHAATSSLVHNRRFTQKSARVLSVNNDTSSSLHNFMPVKYKKEGHAHQLHSVTCPYPLEKPTCSSPSTAIPKSRSTEDILHTYRDGKNDMAENNAPALQIPHSKSFQNLKPATSTSSTEACSIPQLTTTQASPEALPSRPASSLSTRPHPSAHAQSGSEHSFMSKRITFLCTHEGKEIHSSAYDFSIQIPKGTIRKKRTVEFHVGVCLHGPFVFPKGYNLVSPIIMVRSPANAKLKKHLEISLPYCMDLTPRSQKNEQIGFFRANSTCSKGTMCKYTFQPTNSDSNLFELHNNHGKVRTTELGFFCIMAKDTTDTRKHTKYCILPVVPKCVDSSSWKVHYYVIHLLKAFMMVSACGDLACYLCTPDTKQFGCTNIFTLSQIFNTQEY